MAESPPAKCAHLELECASGDDEDDLPRAASRGSITDSEPNNNDMGEDIADDSSHASSRDTIHSHDKELRPGDMSSEDESSDPSSVSEESSDDDDDDKAAVEGSMAAEHRRRSSRRLEAVRNELADLGPLSSTRMVGTPVTAVEWKGDDLQLVFRLSTGNMTARRTLGELGRNDDDATIMDDLSFDVDGDTLEWPLLTLPKVVRCLEQHLRYDYDFWVANARRRGQLVGTVFDLLHAMYGIGWVGPVAHSSRPVLRWLLAGGDGSTNLIDWLDDDSWPLVVKSMSHKGLKELAEARVVKRVATLDSHTLLSARLKTVRQSSDDPLQRAERWLATLQHLMAKIPPAARPLAIRFQFVTHLEKQLAGLTSPLVLGLDLNPDAV